MNLGSGGLAESSLSRKPQVGVQTLRSAHLNVPENLFLVSTQAFEEIWVDD